MNDNEVTRRGGSEVGTWDDRRFVGIIGVRAIHPFSMLVHLRPQSDLVRLQVMGEITRLDLFNVKTLVVKEVDI